MIFTDIHSHILGGVDDGPKDDEQMYSLLEASYLNGARCVCCTPHYYPGNCGHNCVISGEKFRLLTQYARARHPDLTLCLGNELYYSQGCIEWIETGQCRTLNGTRNVLVEFDYDARYQVIEFAVMSFLQRGYIPVLAHIERYASLRRKSKLVMRLRDIGAVIQVNASSVLRPRRHPFVRKLLQQRMVDVIASDTHNLEKRPPLLSQAYAVASRKYGKNYADAIFLYNPNAILNIQTGKESCGDE